MKKLITLLITLVFASVNLWGQSLSVTYTAGDISTNYQSPWVGPSICPGILTFNVPLGNWITGIDVSYSMTAAAGAWMSEQRSKLFSPTTGQGEATYSAGSGNSQGTMNYNRTGLTFANGAFGEVTIHMDAGRTTSGSGCNTTYNKVNNNTWALTVYYELMPACLPPTSLLTSNITSTGALLSWTENNTPPATSWDIELVPAGFTPTGIPTQPAVTKPYNYTNLDPLTSYDWYVRTNCDTRAMSGWAGPATFQTILDPLSGNYTINNGEPTAGTNFKNFNDFVGVISLGGLTGPVVVHVINTGNPYTEQVIFGELNTTAVNTLTINGNNATLQYLSTNTNERATLKLNGTDYVTVNDLIIKSLGTETTEFGFAVQLMNGADYNTFSGCQFITDVATTSTNYAAFVASNSTNITTGGLAASNLTVQNCIVIGGHYGMVINGPTTTPFAENNVLTANEIKNFSNFGLYLRGQNNSLFSGNVISRPDRTTTGIISMIYFTQNMSGSIIMNNQVSGFSPSVASISTSYGIHGMNVSAASNNKLLIVNNVVFGFQNMNGTQYGIFLNTVSGAGNIQIYHNSISHDNVTHFGSGNIACLYHTGATANLDIRNNILSYTSSSSGTKYNLYFNTNTAVVTSNYNVLFRGSSAGTANYTGRWPNVNYETLAHWQAVPGRSFDQNSTDADPLFIEPLITPQNPTINNIGVKLWDVYPVLANDILGTVRGDNPDPGAIEFDPSSCFFPTELSITNITSYSADLGWTESNDPPATLWDIELGPAGFTPTGVPTVSGVEDNPYTYTGLDPITAYEWYVRADCGEASRELSDWAGPHTFTTLVTCPAPTGLTTISTGTTIADVEWISTAGEFEIEYGAAPYTFTGIANITGIMTNSFSFTVLDHSTTYQYKVKAICGEEDESVWSATGSFTTECGVFELPFGEDFTGLTAGQIPNCWSRTHTNWKAVLTSNAGGVSPEMRFNYLPSAIAEFMLISPLINTSGISSLTIEFKHALDYYTLPGNNYTVGVKTSPDGITWNTVWSIIPNSQIVPETLQVEIDNTDVGSASFQFAFFFNGNSYDINSWWFDDIILYEKEPNVPENRVVDGVTLGEDDVECYDAENNITVSNTVIGVGAYAEFRAGVSINFLDGFVVEYGGEMLAKITDVFCTLPLSILASEEVIVAEELPQIALSKSFFNLFPNPTSGRFTLEMKEVEESSVITVEIFGVMGERVLQNQLFGQKQYEFDLSASPRGVYIVRVLQGSETGVMRVIKQ